jgi:hypothetical protein
MMTANTTALGWYAKLGFIFVEEVPFAIGKTLVTHRIGYRTIPPETAPPFEGEGTIKR